MSDQTSSREYQQCVFETRIAARLREANRAERMQLYGEVYAAYAEAFPELVPGAAAGSAATTGFELAFASKFVTSTSIVAEVGPGRCAFAIALAGVCRHVYGIDVVDQSPAGAAPPNFTHLLTDGLHIPLDDQSVDVVVSNQMMEHLHPDDAVGQLKEVIRVLRFGGCYICMTPNRLHGPHDSSARFDDLACPIVDGSYVANGLHLKEYTNAELSRLFRDAGFRHCSYYAGARGRYIRIPGRLMIWCEHWARSIPLKLRKRSKLLQVVLGIRIVAYR